MQSVGGKKQASSKTDKRPRSDKRPRNTQGSVKVRTESMGIQRNYLVQTRSWGSPCNLIELSDFRLEVLWGHCPHNQCHVFFLFCASDNWHLLLFVVHRENVKMLKSQGSCFSCPGDRDDGWHQPGTWTHSGYLQPRPCPTPEAQLSLFKDRYNTVYQC